MTTAKHGGGHEVKSGISYGVTLIVHVSLQLFAVDTFCRARFPNDRSDKHGVL